MIEIELPCCGETLLVEDTLAETVRCDGCSLLIDVAEDAR